MTSDTQVFPGYKQTELGIIPEDWEVITFDDLRDKNDKWSIAGGPFGSSLKSVDYTKSGIRIIQLQNIGDGVFHDDYQIFTSKNKANELIGSNIYPGEILLSKMGDPVARACITPDNYSRYLMCSDGIRLHIDSTNYDRDFVFYFINSKYFRNKAIEASTGSTRQRIGLGDLKKLLFIKPIRTEQKSISVILFTIDLLIQSTDRLIYKKMSIKQGTMQELLTGKKRLPGFNGEWKDTFLGQTGKCYRGVSYNPNFDLTDSDTNSSYRLLRSNNVQASKIVLENMQFVNESRVSKNQVLKIDDVLICMANGSKALVGKAGRFSTDDGNRYTFGAFMSCFRPNTKFFDPDYVFYLFHTEKYHNHINILLAGSSINNLNPSNIENLKINLPLDRKEQTAIAEILSDMDSEIEKLEQKRDKYVMIKQGMMQQLLTGKIRLIKPEDEST